MKRTPAVLQIESTECGAVCLGMVLAWFGRYESPAALRLACGVSRDGTKAAHIVAAARGFGLTACAFRCEPAQLGRWKGRPVIVHWKFNHFVVVEKFGRNKVWINDPASGRRTVSPCEFDQCFTGIVLVFEKAAEFRKGGQPYKAWRGLARRLRATELSFVFLATLALVVPGILAPTLPKVLVDSVWIGGALSWQRGLLAAMIAVAATLAALTFWQQRTLLRIETRLAVESATSFFCSILRLPMEFFQHRHAGEIGYRVSANDRVSGFIAGELAPNLVNLITAGICVSLMLLYDARLATLSLALAMLNLAVLKCIARRRSEISLRLAQEKGKLAGFTTGGLLAIESMKALGGESAFFQQWAGYHAKATNAEQDLQSASQILAAVPVLLGGVTVALALSFGAFRMMDGLLTVGMLLAFLAILQSFLTPVTRLMSLGGRMQEIGGDLQRLDDALEYPRAQLAPPPAPASPERLHGDIELRNVTFGYGRFAPPLIEDLNLTIPAGSRIAFVGGSGSGKSTLARLLCGLAEPWSGQILFDGRLLDAIPRETLTHSIALVDQEVILFEGTVAENIALWDTTLSQGDIVRAARDAVIHDDIIARPGGYQARLDELGRNLSGGQRQRIEIARALAQEPRVLVLDEATSALDPVTEERLMDNLKRRACTLIIIAHRLSTIRDCDWIAVLENGRIAELGTHRDLLHKDGVYAGLLAEQ